MDETELSSAPCSQEAFERAAEFYVKDAAGSYRPVSDEALIDAAVAAL